MKIAEMIEHLQNIENMCGPDQVVRAYCPEGEAYFPVTAFVYGGGDGLVDLYTDEDL